MRRTRLIWFAAGVGTSAVAALIGMMLHTEPKPATWSLYVAEGSQSLHDGEDAANWNGAEIARDCGAKTFDMTPGTAADSVDATRVPLIVENNPALGCIVERARGADLWLGVELD